MCCGECSEVKDHVEQLSMMKSVLLSCLVIALVTTALVCLHDVSLMYTCCGKCLWIGGRSARTTPVAHVMSSPHKPLHYELMSTDGLRGETGLCNPARWQYKEDWHKLFETCRFGHSITSSGVGEDVLMGEALTRKESGRYRV
jgi:hypothetical protein